MGGEAITLIDGLILLAPDGLEICLGEGLSEDYLPSAVDTLQQLGDAFYHNQEADVTDLRATIFNLTLLAQGEDAGAMQTALKKVAGQLQAIPRKDFMKAANSLGLFKPESEMVQIARAALAKSSLMDETVIVHPALVPSLLRWAAECRSEDKAVRKKAIRQLEKIEASLKEAYGEAKEIEDKLSILQQYSHFVILSSGLIPENAAVDLEMLPSIETNDGVTDMEAASFNVEEEIIYLDKNCMKSLSQKLIFNMVRHESIHVLQDFEAMRTIPTETEFQEIIFTKLGRLVAMLRHHPYSRKAMRSSMIQAAYASSYRKIRWRLLRAIGDLRHCLNICKKSPEFAKQYEALASALHFTGWEDGIETQRHVYQKVAELAEKDKKLDKLQVKQLREFMQEAIEAIQAQIEHPIEKMADTPFEYGRADELFDRFFTN